MQRVLIVILPMLILIIAYLISRRANENSTGIVKVIDDAVNVVQKIVTENVTGGDVAKYFKYSEFECPCCSLNLTKQELLKVLDEAREHFGKPMVVNSGTRCAKHNKKVGGGKYSQHLLGTAADVWVVGVPAHKVYDYFIKKYPNKYGIGKYSTFTHIDVRPNRARWVG